MKKALGAIKTYFRTTDIWLFLFCIACSTLSALLLGGLYNDDIIYFSVVKMQITAALLGLLFAIILSKIDYRFIAKMWMVHAPLALILVGLTFVIGYGVEGVDDKAWLKLFGVSVQPAEFLKISFIMTFAYHLSLVKEHLNDLKNLIPVCVHGGIPVLLVHLQGDDGTAVIFALMFAIMLFAAGLSWKYLMVAGGALIAALPVIWFQIMDEDKRLRFLAVFDPENPEFKDIVYQQYHGLVSIGSGGVWGKGIFSGGHRNSVPKSENDFIFSFAGEAIGFVGCVAIILLLAFICFRVFFTSRRSTDPLGRYICIGVFAMIVSQAVINIGMNLSVMPVIGVTLPFFSAGGSSVLSIYLGIGLALSVYMYNQKGLFADNVRG